MSWSIGEIADLAIKAARGAGRPWGEAEELGWAVRWLARTGLPGPEAAADLLKWQDGTDPLRAGLAIADSGEFERLDGANALAAPLLVLPFLSRIAPPDKAWRIRVGEVELRVWRDGADEITALTGPARIRIIGDCSVPAIRCRKTRIEYVDPAALAALQALAARTYAPATEESRRKGAGAGLTDND